MEKERSQPNRLQYYWIYKDLVKDAMSKDKHDIVGYIAYSIYKREKIEHIEDLKKKNGGEEPTFEELEPFRMMADQRKDEYIKAANRVIQQYITEVVEYEKKSHGFMYGVWQSLTANLIWLALAMLFYFAIKYGWIGLPNISIQ